MLFFIFLIHVGILIRMFMMNDNIFVDVNYENLLLVLSVFVVGLCIGFFFGNNGSGSSDLQPRD